MRTVLAVLAVACAGPALAGKAACYEEPGTMRAWCYDPAAVRENGPLRAAPMLAGGPKGVSPTGLTFVVDCQQKVAAMQDASGVNRGASRSSATPLSRNFTDWICAEQKTKRYPTLRLR
jgi:hypothetical protein